MSLLEFSGSMQERAAATAKIAPALERLLVDSRRTYKDDENKLRKLASLFEQDAKAFRKAGSVSGKTRLVVTPESLSSILEALLSTNKISGVNSTKTGDELLKLYIKFLASNGAKIADFEFYNDKGNTSNLTKFENIKDYYDNIPKKYIIEGKELPTPRVFDRTTAIRGLKFTHANTATHMVEFLHTLGSTITNKEFTDLFERGHVYAQATGRLMTLEGIDLEEGVLGKLIKLNMLLDEASSHLNKPVHTELLASIKKDFKGTDLYMNIEFQLKRSDSGTGNQDTGNISGILQMVSNYRKLMTEGTRRPNGTFQQFPIVSSDAVISEIMTRFANKISTNFEKIQNILNQHISNASDPDFLVNLKSSITSKQYITSIVIGALTNTEVSKVDIKHPKVPITKIVTNYKDTIASIKKVVRNTSIDLAKAKQDLASKKLAISKLKQAKLPPIRTTQGQFYSLANLQMLINTHLQDVISANMGNGGETRILNYRTGRFAASANVERMSQSREGAISAFYTYMKNPYQTFEPGFKQGSPKTRDPKTLIGTSIKEIAATKVGNRLRAVLI